MKKIILFLTLLTIYIFGFADGQEFVNHLYGYRTIMASTFEWYIISIFAKILGVITVLISIFYLLDRLNKEGVREK
jgi:uncharacterized membrane protein